MRARMIRGFLLAFVMVLALGAPALAADFTDVAGSPFEASINSLADQSIVGGYDDGTFRPNNLLQRQQFAKMAVLTMGYELTTADVSTFPDSPAPYDPDNNPLYPGSYVAVAAENEIILGKADGNFDFSGNITRQQAITIVVRAAGDLLAEPDADYAGVLSYTDPNHGANIKKAEFNGLLAAIPGLATWDLTAPATRGEAAEVLAQLLEVVGPGDFSRVVSTAWLEANRDMEGLVTIDTRPADAYAADHIPGAINIPAGFYVNTALEDMAPGGLYMELPEDDALFALIGNAGITAESRVVVVGGLDPMPTFGLADSTRVADTLIYAGVKNVAVLDGSYVKWVDEGRSVSTEAPTVTPVEYTATVDASMWVSTEYVADHIGDVILLDTRDTEVYTGEEIEPWAPVPGHIESALSLPAPLIWEEAGWVYNSVGELEQIVVTVFTADKTDEIIIYCGVGGYESAWWYVLTQMLGYTNVKMYDGAAQAWVVDHDMVVSAE